jgi:hypothetical protein
MHKTFLALCFALYPAIAGATNYDVCVSEARTNHTDTAAEGYASYKCEGTTAEKLTARPDECTDGGALKPALRSLVRKSRQLDDGLYTSLTWIAGRCTGACETRSYDSKDTTYLCEVRVYAGDGRPADTRPAATRPAETRPAETRPAETRHAETSREPAPGPGPRSHRRRPSLSGPWSPPPPRRYSRYAPGFSGLPWYPPAPPPMPYPREDERYLPESQQNCWCN